MLEKRPVGTDAAEGSGQSLSMRAAMSVLLGAAAAFGLTSGARAGDMTDKAEPVQFVKICAVEGHSYYYIPGNDVCSKNGLSFTIGTDNGRSRSLMNLSAVSRFGAQPGDHAAETWPDPFISLRADQSWGYGVLVGGARNLNSAYTGDNSGLGRFTANGFNACLQAGRSDCGRAAERPDFFAGLGGAVDLPLLGAGNRIGAGVSYSQGSPSSFSGMLNLSSPELFGAGSNPMLGLMPDGGAGIELTKAWSVQAGYDHQWSSALNTSLFAGYSNITYDAQPGSAFSTATCAGNGAGGAIGLSAGAVGCKSNWGNVGAGLRTSWAPASGLTLSVQTMYNYSWTGSSGGANTFGAAPSGHSVDGFNFANQGVWSSYLRIDRSFNSSD
jgi:hypothetical protein